METSDSGKNSDWLFAPTCTTGNQYILPTLSHIGETALKSESRRLLKMFRFRVAVKVFFLITCLIYVQTVMVFQHGYLVSINGSALVKT